MSRIYTRGGDRGETGLLGGTRVPKTDARVQACGGLDELNAALGVALAQLPPGELRDRIASLQPDLFALTAHVATPPQAVRERALLPAFPPGRAAELEGWIDQAEEELPPLRRFILPGGCAAGAGLQLARAICRRAERALVAVPSAEAAALVYLNRLSDYLFVSARLANHRAGVPEVQWLPGPAALDGDAGAAPAPLAGAATPEADVAPPPARCAGREVDVADVTEVPEGVAREFEAAGETIVLCRQQGRIHALASRCPYHPVPLDGSPLEGSTLVCRWYGAAFDVETGAARGLSRVPPLLTFPATVRGGRVLVRLGDRRRALPAE